MSVITFIGEAHTSASSMHLFCEIKIFPLSKKWLLLPEHVAQMDAVLSFESRLQQSKFFLVKSEMSSSVVLPNNLCNSLKGMDSFIKFAWRVAIITAKFPLENFSAAIFWMVDTKFCVPLTSFLNSVISFS